MLNGRNREIIDFAGRVSDVSKRMGYSAGLLLLFLLSLTSLPVEAQSNICLLYTSPSPRDCS